MEVTTHTLDSIFASQVNEVDSTTTVDSKLILSMESGNLVYSITSVPPYKKVIRVEGVDVNSFIGSNDKTIFLASVNGKFAGRIKVISWWNGFAYIDELVVNPEFRGKGVGHALMDRAIEWAKTKRFPGVMLETQNDNVPACKLYESCGFVLSGFDQNLYKNTNPNTKEIALYWYLIF